jgi:hypothetical protein
MKDLKFKIVTLMMVAVASTSAIEDALLKDEVCTIDEDPHPRRKLDHGLIEDPMLFALLVWWLPGALGVFAFCGVICKCFLYQCCCKKWVDNDSLHLSKSFSLIFVMMLFTLGFELMALTEFALPLLSPSYLFDAIFGVFMLIVVLAYKCFKNAPKTTYVTFFIFAVLHVLMGGFQ